MITELVDKVDSLIGLMAAETDGLKTGIAREDCAQIAEAKARLTASLEKEMMYFDRHAGDWAASADDEAKSLLLDKIRKLEDTARENAAAITRSLRMSGEIIEAISAEVKRISGNRSVSYRPSGTLNDSSRSAPISINTAL